MSAPLLRREPTLRPSPTRGLEEYRHRARDWFGHHTPGEVPDDLDGRFDVLRDWQRRLYDAGYVGIAIPTEAGGQGLTDAHQYVVTEELARAGLPPPIGLIGLDVVGPTLVGYGSERQRRHLLPPLLSGEEIWCQGFSEPGAGSDLAALSTKAVRRGETFHVSGQKVWTSWAHKARRCALLARTGGPESRHRGLTYLIVDMTAPGITVRPLTQMTGESEFCEVFFDDVEVPVDDAIGAPEQGWSIAMDTLSHERATYAFRRRVESTAAYRGAVAEIRSACAPEQAPPAEPAPRAEPPEPPEPPERLLAGLGRAEVALAALEGQNAATLRRLLSHPGPAAMDSVDKLVVNDCEQTVFAALADWTGASAAVTDAAEYGVPSGRAVREYLYSRAASIYGGTAQIQRTIVATRGLGLGQR